MKKYTSGSFTATKYAIYKEDTDTITTFPTAIIADGENASAIVYGNMLQTGTPTPSSPIQPQECGDLSENLYNASNPNIFKGFYATGSNSLATNPNNAFIYIPLVQGRKYYVYGCKRYNTSVTIRWVTTSSRPSGNELCIRTGEFAQTDVFTITAETNENYLAIFLCGDSDYSAYGTVEDAIAANGANLTIDNGYKIPISSANTTTNIYLGEMQTIRNIKKLVLDGTENWQARTGEPSNVYFCTKSSLGIVTMEGRGLCTHYKYTTGTSFSTIEDGEFILTSTNLGVRDLQISSVYDFKTYLAAQYANDTPVTIWYVLTESTTGIFNDPLRKIGNYSDTVTATIPTIAAADNINVTTTLKPSALDITYTGWHKYDDKKRSSGAWT